MKYFSACKTIEDVKQTFKKLVKLLHPDNGGDAEAFKIMMAEYETAFNRLKNTHRTQEGETYTTAHESTETPQEFAELIRKLMKMDGVIIEIIGSWVWLTGNTMINKDQIKELGFFWSKSKRAWYYNGSDKKTKRRGRYSMDGLRNKWGSEMVGTGRDDTAKIAGAA